MSDRIKIEEHLQKWADSKGWVVRAIYRIIKKELIEEVQKILDKLK
jgi:hypothetical protein